MRSRELYAHPQKFLTGRGLTDEQAIVRYFVLMCTSATISVALRLGYHWCQASLTSRLRSWEMRRRRALYVPVAFRPLARLPPRYHYARRDGA